MIDIFAQIINMHYTKKTIKTEQKARLLNLYKKLETSKHVYSRSVDDFRKYVYYLSAIACVPQAEICRITKLSKAYICECVAEYRGVYEGGHI